MKIKIIISQTYKCFISMEDLHKVDLATPRILKMHWEYENTCWMLALDTASHVGHIVETSNTVGTDGDLPVK